MWYCTPEQNKKKKNRWCQEQWTEKSTCGSKKIRIETEIGWRGTHAWNMYLWHQKMTNAIQMYEAGAFCLYMLHTHTDNGMDRTHSRGIVETRAHTHSFACRALERMYVCVSESVIERKTLTNARQHGDTCRDTAASAEWYATWQSSILHS